MYLLNKFLQFMSTILQELNCRISEYYANTCRPGGVCQTTHKLQGCGRKRERATKIILVTLVIRIEYFGIVLNLL